MVRQDRACGGAPAGRAALSTVGWIADVTTNPAPRVIGGAATRASCGVGPLRDFYVALLAKGMKPEMARLTLARKIAAIALTLWKKEECFDAEQLKPQAA